MGSEAVLLREWDKEAVSVESHGAEESCYGSPPNLDELPTSKTHSPRTTKVRPGHGCFHSFGRLATLGLYKPAC